MLWLLHQLWRKARALRLINRHYSKPAIECGRTSRRSLVSSQFGAAHNRLRDVHGRGHSRTKIKPVLASLVRRILSGRSSNAFSDSGDAVLRSESLCLGSGVLGLPRHFDDRYGHLKPEPTSESRDALARLIATSTPNPAQDADRLIQSFGSLGSVLDAKPERLSRQTNPAAVEQILACRAVQMCALINEIVVRPLMSDPQLLNRYLRSRLAHLGVEQVRVLFLDTGGRLISDELICDGTVSESAIFPRELVRRALELNASGLILTHNHPSQDPQPSSSDIRVTEQLRRAAACLDITLCDHIIVGSRNFSMRAAGMLR